MQKDYLPVELSNMKIEDLGVRAITTRRMNQLLNVVTVGDFLRKVKGYNDFGESFRLPSDWKVIEDLLTALDKIGIRIADCSKEEYPNIKTYVIEKTAAKKEVTSFGGSREFVAFLKDKGCSTMADVLKLTSKDLANLSGELRNSAINYIRAMDRRVGWRFSDATVEICPDIENYINEYFGLNIADLPLSTRIQNSFIKHKITTTTQLTQYSRQDLLTQKIVGESALIEITELLQQNRLKLSGDVFSSCDHCLKEIVRQQRDSKSKYCLECQTRMKRISKMKEIVVTITGPDYGNYTNLTSGFTLYANIENRTDNLLQVELIDFYLFSGGRQRTPQYFLTGYAFNREHIFAKTSKTVGKIFSASGMKDSKLEIGDYLIIKLRTKMNHYMMYKFVYTGPILDVWRIDDYSEFQ